MVRKGGSGFAQAIGLMYVLYATVLLHEAGKGGVL